MPGSILYDFGDMVRSFASLLQEEDASKAKSFSSDIYEALLKGYLTLGDQYLTKKDFYSYPPV